MISVLLFICHLSKGSSDQLTCRGADHLWWSNAPGRASHPNNYAPRCLPCNYPDQHLDQSKAPFRAPKGCPCTPQLLCSTDERGIFNEFCDIPRAPVATYSMHGGAGGIMSVGLLRAVSLQFMEMCIKSLYSTGDHPPPFPHPSANCKNAHCIYSKIHYIVHHVGW